MNNIFPTIETDRFILKQFTDNDLENVYKGLSNKDVIKHYGISYNSLEGTKEQLKWFNDLEINKTGLWWAIYSKSSDLFLGAGGLNNLEKEHNKAEYGFWLLPENWGKGIMKEVTPHICNYGFSKMNIHRIEGLIESNNTKVQKALAKLNFNYEGTMHDCEIKNGKYINIDIYAVINK